MSPHRSDSPAAVVAAFRTRRLIAGAMGVALLLAVFTAFLGTTFASSSDGGQEPPALTALLMVIR